MAPDCSTFSGAEPAPSQIRAELVRAFTDAANGARGLLRGRGVPAVVVPAGGDPDLLVHELVHEAVLISDAPGPEPAKPCLSASGLPMPSLPSRWM